VVKASDPLATSAAGVPPQFTVGEMLPPLHTAIPFLGRAKQHSLPEATGESAYCARSCHSAGRKSGVIPAIENWISANQTAGSGNIAILTIKHANLQNLFGSLPRPRKSKAALGDKGWKKLTSALGEYQTFSGNCGYFGFAYPRGLASESGSTRPWRITTLS
jgi:hypothetical protein